MGFSGKSPSLSSLKSAFHFDGSRSLRRKKAEKDVIQEIDQEVQRFVDLIIISYWTVSGK